MTKEEFLKEIDSLMAKLRTSVEQCNSDVPELSTRIMARNGQALFDNIIKKDEFDKNYIIVDNFNVRFKNICACHDWRNNII